MSPRSGKNLFSWAQSIISKQACYCKIIIAQRVKQFHAFITPDGPLLQSKEPTTEPYPNSGNPNHILKPYLFKMQLNILFPYLRNLTFSNKILCEFLNPPKRHVFRPYASWFCHPKIIWQRTQFTKPVITQPSTCYVHFLTSSYSLRRLNYHNSSLFLLSPLKT